LTAKLSLVIAYNLNDKSLSEQGPQFTLETLSVNNLGIVD